MRNRVCTTDDVGKEWLSRHMCVGGFLLYKTKESFDILILKRGSAVEYSGLWSLPGGYLEYNETLKQALSREINEETSLLYFPEDFSSWMIRDKPVGERQNVTAYFYTMVSCKQEPEDNIQEYSKGETEEVRWIDIRDICNYNWAFNHDKLIIEFLCNHITS